MKRTTSRITLFVVAILACAGLLFITGAGPSHYSEFVKAIERSGIPMPAPDTMAKILGYLDGSSSHSFDKAFDLMLEQNLAANLAGETAKTRKIHIDGDDSDWENSGFTVADPTDDTVVADRTKAVVAPREADDLVSYGFVHGDGYLYCMVKPKKMPEKGTEYHYRLNIEDMNFAIVYAVIWTSSGNGVQVWNPENGRYIRLMTDKSFFFSSGTCYEARIPVSALPALPVRYYTEAVAWAEQRNLYDSVRKPSYDTALEVRYENNSLRLFCRYAEKIDLTPEDPDPMLLAVNEALIYKLAGREVRDRVVDDGLEFLAVMRENKLPDDIALRENLLKRSGMWGGYDGIGFLLLPDGTMSAEAYSFMFINADSIRTARRMLTEKGMSSGTETAKTVEAIETWLWKVNKYRRYYFADIEALYRAYPNDPTVKTYYNESLQEQKNGDVNITTIDGRQINKGAVFSAAFQVQYLSEHGYFYGNCVDVATLAQLFNRALAIPTVTVTYGSIGPGFYKEIHTFAVWRSDGDKRWHPYLAGGNKLYFWAKNGTAPVSIWYYIDKGQEGSYWTISPVQLGDRTVNVSARVKPVVVSEETWTGFNTAGFDIP